MGNLSKNERLQKLQDENNTLKKKLDELTDSADPVLLIDLDDATIDDVKDVVAGCDDLETLDELLGEELDGQNRDDFKAVINGRMAKVRSQMNEDIDELDEILDDDDEPADDADKDPDDDDAEGSDDGADDSEGDDDDSGDDTAPDPDPETPALSTDMILSGTVGDVKAAVADVDDVDALEALLAAELDGENRKGAKAAIDSRINELEGVNAGSGA